MRMILQDSQSKSITLERELESLALYLNLEMLRFGGHFSYHIHLPEFIDASALLIPPLVIQPYVENAVWHGLMHKEEKGMLTIDISVAEEFLMIKIMDDGIGRKKASSLSEDTGSTHKSLGLGITSKRIAIAHEKKSTETWVFINDLMDSSGQPCGTEVTIKLPMTYD
jgi:LytS/YehU family sensor histidine kinase